MQAPIVDDELWILIEPLLPPPKPRRTKNPGRFPVPNRAALNGILFVLKTGIRWNHLPTQRGFGSGATCWRRLRDWHEAGVWDRLHELLLAKLRAADQIDFSRAAVDSSSVRAVGAGQKLARTPLIARDPAPSTTSSPTPPARTIQRSALNISRSSYRRCGAFFVISVRYGAAKIHSSSDTSVG
jgi:transposase